MRFFLTKRSSKSKLLTILFILLFLTLISSLLVSNALAIDSQSTSDAFTFSSLGIETKTLSSENGQETSETFSFDLDIDDTAHNRFSIHLQYQTGVNRPSTDFDMVFTINDEYTIKNSIFRFIEGNTKHWRHIEIPFEYMKDGTNQIAITISFKSLTNTISTFTVYGESYFEITKTLLIQSTGNFQFSDLGLVPSDTYEDRVVATSMIGGYYSSTFEPQVEFFLQGNMTSVNAQLDLMLQKDVPTDCEVTYNVYVNDKALFNEDKLFEETRIQISLTNLKAGRNSIKFQILINSYRVSAQGGDTPYTFRVQLEGNSVVSFSSSNFSTGSNSEISTIGIPNVLSFSLVLGILIIIPSFLFITLKYKRSFVKEIKVQTLSYVDANDSGKIKTLRIREETS